MHHRSRHILGILKKRAKMFPVLGVLGPRQVGKSTFLMKEWREAMDAVYLTFDKQEIAQRARRSPEQLLSSESDDFTRHLIIDEAQKVPAVFDSIKAMIDENRRLGRYTLSGSVEFSIKSGVRESLAGRMGITRLFPMTLSELNGSALYAPWLKCHFSDRPVSLKSTIVEKWLVRGGMPIFCCFSEKEERMGVIHAWLEAICYRDLKQLYGADYDPELALNLLRTIALKSEAPISMLSLTELGATTASIKKHLMALESLFLIYKVPSFENPAGQCMYKIFDAGVINGLLDGHETIYSQRACLLSLVMNEIYAQFEYSGKTRPAFHYYRTRGGAEIDLVLKMGGELIGVDCSLTTDLSPYRLRGMKSFLANYPNAKGIIISPVQEQYKIESNLMVLPWNEIG